MRKAYFGRAGAQIHYRHWPAKTPSQGAVILLPPAPHSGVFFETAALRMSETHDIYAVDYPGYGGSDPFDHTPSIDRYAQSLAPFLKSFAPVSLVGFHTGNLVACALALRADVSVSDIIMVDVPFFDAATAKSYDAKLGDDALPADIATLYDKAVLSKGESAQARAYAIWVETLRSGARHNDAFRAAFAFDCAASFAKITQNVTVAGTESFLFALSEQAAKVLPNATFLDWRDIKSPAFEQDGGVIGTRIAAALS